MAAEKLGNLGLTQGWETGQFYWGGPMNGNLVMLDTVINLVVKQGGLNAPPSEGVTNGEVFAVGSNPTGPWADQSGKLALFFQDSWQFITPKRGWRALFESQGTFLWYNGETWVIEGTNSNPEDPDPPESGPTHFDIAVSVIDVIDNAATVLHLPVISAMFLPGNMQGSMFDMRAAAGSDAQLKVLRNGSEIGLISVTSGEFNAAMTTSGGQTVTFNVGDRLTLVGPDISVPSLRDFGLVLRFGLM